MGVTLPKYATAKPAVIQLSPLLQTQGNPNLLPAFDHNIRLQSTLSMPQKRINLNIRGEWSYM